ncbi:hypothetical protein [Streptomyces sp. bgisy060]|uniref:hypothetical protein n=1 Tax=Streptomyces sp. bgisy060 TaxID=3413775 RepID=UPI003EBF379E
MDTTFALALAFGLGLAAAAGAATGCYLSARQRPAKTCTWCAEVSGFPVAGHDTRECRGYVQDLRRARLRRMAATGRHEPNYWGNLWRLPEEMTTEQPQPEH